MQTGELKIQEPPLKKIILQFSLFREESSHNFTIITDWGIEDPRTISEQNYPSIFPLHIFSPTILPTRELKMQDPVLGENRLWAILCLLMCSVLNIYLQFIGGLSDQVTTHHHPAVLGQAS